VYGCSVLFDSKFPARKRRDDVEYDFDDCLWQAILEMVSLRVHVYFMCLGASYFFSSELARTNVVNGVLAATLVMTVWNFY